MFYRYLLEPRIAPHCARIYNFRGINENIVAGGKYFPALITVFGRSTTSPRN